MGLKCLIFDCYIYLVFLPDLKYRGCSGMELEAKALVLNPAPVLWKRHYVVQSIAACE